MPELCTIYDYMRAHAGLLGERILQEYPALHQFDDPVSPRIQELLRTPFPAQTIAIMGVAKRWQKARSAMVVAECGTGKTLISLGAMHVYGRDFNGALSLKALTFFEDGDLPSLASTLRKRLLEAATSVNLRELPAVVARSGLSRQEES